MSQIHHPSEILLPAWVETIRKYAGEAEQSGRLHPKQLELIYEQEWFNLLAPQIYGGLQKSLPEIIRTEEALSWADGSLGWVVTLCSGAGFFGGYISPAIAPGIFADKEVCLAGSGADTGTAKRHKDGYIINGSWKYASGVHHATYITINCRIMDKSGNELLKEGMPLIRSFIIDRADVQLQPGWKYVGMIATGSDAYKIENIYVPEDRCFEIAPQSAVVKDRLYHYPFLQLAEATLAANLSGMAVNFTDLCGDAFAYKATNLRRVSSKNADLMMEERQYAVNLLNDARLVFHEAVNLSWGDIENKDYLKAVSSASRVLARIARETVDELYPYCGLLAASPDTEINRVWRDIHTASQHSLLTFLEL
ncbi:hypothetical protein CKK33_03435 [Mucilaginibacter sp. MD40]|uniref:acyl-CoA dehydrogenase n=1 Tax=Mucilaginibacter sp. MD40 TaxID=2029590 RepID=UPI000BAC8F1D|nr:acyl-CoA dehydrogenase [Mucilaginibacter sp. MD40]PAW92599.1 hypothetical protein CKK33_03435 [Mucilaginibacter sp. MD40]